jgi:dTDP-glucose 4,6-dehydratase
MKKKVAVVAGGAGFLGSHLCDRLLADGCKVIAVDNLLTGSTDNIKHLNKNKDFDFLKKDITQPFAVPGKVDYVLQFASPASPVDYLKYPIQTLKVGSYGTHNALILAQLKNARFVVASTSEVYGDPLEHPQKETYWGNVNHDGSAQCLRRSQAFCRSHHDGVSPLITKPQYRRSCAFSIRTVRACRSRMAAWFRILSTRRCTINL